MWWKKRFFFHKRNATWKIAKSRIESTKKSSDVCSRIRRVVKDRGKSVELHKSSEATTTGTIQQKFVAKVGVYSHKVIEICKTWPWTELSISSMRALTGSSQLNAFIGATRSEKVDFGSNNLLSGIIDGKTFLVENSGPVSSWTSLKRLWNSQLCSSIVVLDLFRPCKVAQKSLASKNKIPFVRLLFTPFHFAFDCLPS